MDLKAHARHSLTFGRHMTASILDTFSGDDQWLYQSHPKANHAMWIVGHLGLADNAFASQFREDRAHKPEGFEELFWFGTELRSEASAYPPMAEVRQYFDERRANLLQVLEDVTEEELAAPAPPAGERSPVAGAPCMGHLFLFAAVHEAMHAGQLSVAHRGLGNAPIFSP